MFQNSVQEKYLRRINDNVYGCHLSINFNDIDQV
jgi:hypothetical protein